MYPPSITETFQMVLILSLLVPLVTDPLQIFPIYY